MANKLTEICADKRAYVAEKRAMTDAGEMAASIAAAAAPRGFEQALRRRTADGFALIAEIKRASPSKGLIREDFDPPAHARAYESGGAACLSILTDAPYFQGADEYLVAAREAVSLPCLRKDFMVDPWQVAESRALGADAILIILAALDQSEAAAIEEAALELGMDALIEVHDEAEMERALGMRSQLIGINNRDLKSFVTDLAVTERLAPMAGKNVLLVGESGITGHADCERLARSGVNAFLVGETLMRQEDVAAATRELLGAT